MHIQMHPELNMSTENRTEQAVKTPILIIKIW